MTTGLVIGYGRAGKRHGKMLDELGIEWHVAEPDQRKVDRIEKFFFQDLESAIEDGGASFGLTFGFAVIATPPDLHLAQIRQCLDAGLPVLCEKPLCGLGQLAEAEALLRHPGVGKVMVAYNWRFHPELRNVKEKEPFLAVMFCFQNRQLPEWGLLLDHCSHDLDIMSFLLGNIEIQSAEFEKDAGWQSWKINTNKGSIIEQVVNYLCERKASLTYRVPPREYLHGGIIGLDPDPAMYTAMWEAFLSGKYEPGLAEAIETQRLLERCNELGRET